MPDIEHLEIDGKSYDIADSVAREGLNEINDKVEDIKNSSANGLSTELKTRYDTATLQSMYNEVIEPSPEEWFKVEIDNDNNTATWVGMNSKKYQDFATVKQLVIPYQFQGAILKTIGNGTECMGWDIPELTAVKLPNCVTEISQKAFKDAAENLENINIPLSCTKIGYEAFSTCSKLKTVEVSDLNQNFTIGECCFDQCVLTNINPLLEKIETLPAESFSFHLTQNIIIPENIVQIEREALTNTHEEWFRYSVTILNPNCEIHKHAFTNNKLTLIKGYKGSTAETFANTYNIPFMSIEGTEVLDKADKADIDAKMDLLSYYGDTNITPTDSSLFEFDESTGTITGYIGNTGHLGDNIDVVIPYEINSIKVLHIGEQVFWRKYINNIIIPNTVISIGSYAFGNCGFTNFTIPNSVTNIDDYAFYECGFLRSINIPDSVTRIGDYAFDDCMDLTIVIIPDSVAEMSYDTFRGCNNLTVVCNSGSYAEAYCQENNINYVLDTVSPDSLGGGSITVDQTYDAESENAQSGKAIAEAVDNKVDKKEGYNLLHIAQYDSSTFILSQDDGMEYDVYYAHVVRSIEDQKADKSEIHSTTESSITFKFAYSYNDEIRADTLDSISFTFEDSGYDADYTSGLSFDSGETPTAIDYTDSGILNWVGTDCVTSNGLSIFQPSPNTHYDIVFYFNGVQFIGLVNGFVPATGNVVSE